MMELLQESLRTCLSSGRPVSQSQRLWCAPHAAHVLVCDHNVMIVSDHGPYYYHIASVKRYPRTILSTPGTEPTTASHANGYSE